MKVIHGSNRGEIIQYRFPNMTYVQCTSITHFSNIFFLEAFHVESSRSYVKGVTGYIVLFLRYV